MHVLILYRCFWIIFPKNYELEGQKSIMRTSLKVCMSIPKFVIPTEKKVTIMFKVRIFKHGDNASPSMPKRTFAQTLNDTDLANDQHPTDNLWKVTKIGLRYKILWLEV